MGPIFKKRTARTDILGSDPFAPDEAMVPSDGVSLVAGRRPSAGATAAPATDRANGAPPGSVSGFFPATTTADDTGPGVPEARKPRRRKKRPPQIGIARTLAGEMVLGVYDAGEDIYRIVPGGIQTRLLWRIIWANGSSVRETSFDPRIKDMSGAVCDLNKILWIFCKGHLVVRTYGDADLQSGPKAVGLSGEWGVRLKLDKLVIAPFPLPIIDIDHVHEVFAEEYGTRCPGDPASDTVNGVRRGARAYRKP